MQSKPLSCWVMMLLTLPKLNTLIMKSEDAMEFMKKKNVPPCFICKKPVILSPSRSSNVRVLVFKTVSQFVEFRVVRLPAAFGGSFRHLLTEKRCIATKMQWKRYIEFEANTTIFIEHFFVLFFAKTVFENIFWKSIYEKQVTIVNRLVFFEF